MRSIPSALQFVGIREPGVRTVHPARHYADKVHAYTRPRQYRSPVKGLVDLALPTLELEKDIGAPDRIRAEVERVYSLYPTHEPWGDLPPPPGTGDHPLRARPRKWDSSLRR